ncbi:flippase [Natronococcus sp. A-GB7]|uniref:flippase n=1 Tax=Natronococcus sp. A-GB7 TaxID=3037649 RepID=UPI00241E8AA2|nr:flippase [Natronococcus sp. A-GB7]MDG5819723.1 flippase [Natronococcus sp. A-GB7]
MTKTSTLVSRFRVALGGQAVVAASGVVVAVVLARLLGPTDYGLLFLALSILSIFLTFSKLGIARSAARYISEYKETNPGQVPHIVRSSFWMNALTIAITCLVLLFSHRAIAVRVGEPNLAPFLLLGVLYLIFETLFVYFKYMLQGFERIEHSVLVKVTRNAGTAVFAVAFVLLGFGAFGALGGYIFASFLSTVVGAVLVRDNYTESISHVMEDGLRRRIAEYSVPITATSTMANLDKGMDIVLIGFFLNPAAVSFYVVANQITTFIDKPMSAAGFTLSPTFGAEKAKQNTERAGRIYEYTLLTALTFYIPATAGLILVAGPVVELLFGSEYRGAVPVLQVLAVYAVFVAVLEITSHSLDYLGRARTRAVIRGVAAVCNLLLNIVLIPTVGVVGAAISTVVTHGAYTLACVLLIHYEFGLDVGKITKRLGRILGVTASMSLVVFVLVGYVTGWITLFLVVGIGFALWLGCSVAIGLVEPRDALAILN